MTDRSEEHFVLDGFGAPDSAHLPAAYWFWHRLPSDDEIVSQVKEMERGGIHAFQVQARLAYPREEYLGPEFLRACRRAVDEAARRQMTVGIYDEYNWQSGHAGGRTVAGRDELRERHLFWAPARMDAGGKLVAEISGITSSTEHLGPPAMAWHYDGGVAVFGDWHVEAVAAAPRARSGSPEVVDATGAATVAGSTSTGCTVEVDPGALVGAEDVTVFCSARCLTSRIPNYLLAATARRFLEVGCDPYAEALAEHLGTTVQYLFFDQPHANVYAWNEHFGNLRSSLPFSAELADVARVATGVPLATALLALLCDVGAATASLRARFYDAFTELVCTNYLGTLRAWTERHGVALSGHEVLGHVGSWNPGASFSSWDLRTNFGLDHFRVDRYRQLTGVDAQDCVPQLSTKFGDSVARAHGRSGCIVEQYMLTEPGSESAFAGHWGLTLEELRAQAIRLHLLGARQFLFHAFYQTDGNGEDFTRLLNPRFDFAPGINFEPWWPYHREFAEESGRLSAFLDDAEPACDVAVLYPLRTAWAEGAGHSWGEHLAFWAQFLAEAGYGYHLVDEADLAQAEVAGGRVVFGNRSYGCVVLPSVTVLRDEESARVLAAFAAGGGRLVATGDTPRALQYGAGLLEDLWAKVAGSEHYRHHAGVPDAARAKAMLGELRDARPHALVQDADGATLWQWIGHDGEAWRVVLFNDAAHPRAAALAVPFEEGVVQRWHPQDGTRSAWEALGEPGGPVAVALGPMELRCLRVRARADGEVAAPHRPRSQAAVESVLTLGEGWTLELHADAPGAAPHTVSVDVERGWEQQGFPRTSGVGTYRTTLRLDGHDGAAVLALPVVHCAAEVRWDGTLVGRKAWAPYEFPLPGATLAPGEHHVEIDVASSAANRYFGGTPFDPGPVPSGLGAPPELRLLAPG